MGLAMFVHSHVGKDSFLFLAKGIYAVKWGTDLILTLIMLASHKVSYQKIPIQASR